MNENETIHLQKGAENKKLAATIKRAERSQNPVIRSTPIISFSGKRKKKLPSFRAFILPLVSLFLACCLLFSYTERSLGPKMGELAEIQAKAHLTAIINQAVGEMAEAGELNYDRMVRTIRDSSGEVIYLEVNTGMLAGAKAHLVDRIRNKIEQEKRITLKVPLGNLTGWNLFSGIGLPVRVLLFPIGVTEGEIYTVLEDCGINQTRHLIQVDIKSSLTVVLPGENKTVETSVTLPLGERVLVGDVPEIYLDTLGEG